jgi:hypothetical protein
MGGPRKSIEEKRRDKYGQVTVRIDPSTEMVIPVDVETRLLAQRLMLREWEGVSSVAELFGYAVRRLAESTE